MPRNCSAPVAAFAVAATVAAFFAAGWSLGGWLFDRIMAR